MTWTLQAYILREMTRSFVMTALVLIAILSMGGGVFNMIQVEELSADQLLKLMLLIVPVAAALTLPVAAMFSAAATYGRLATDNEFVACRASGVNVQMLLVPALLLSVITGSITFICINTIIPRMVGSLDEIVGWDLRTLVSQRLRRSGGDIPGRKGYRMYWDDAPPLAADVKDSFVLLGVTFMEMDDDSVVRIGTAEKVWVRLKEQDGRARVAGQMEGVTHYVPRDGQFFESATMLMPPVEFEVAVPAKLKFLTLTDLLQLRGDPGDWVDVRSEVDRLRIAVARAKTRERVLRHARELGAFQLGDSSESLRVETTAAAFIDKDGGVTWQQPEDHPIVVIEKRDGAERRITAPRLVLEIGRESTLEELGVTLQLFDGVVVGDFASPEATIRVPEWSPPPLPLPRAVMDEVAALDGPALLAWAATTAAETDADPLVVRQKTRAEQEWSATLRKITGVIHQRFAFAFSVPVLVTLAAVLGVVLRDSQMITAFGISFVPSLLVLIAIITGKQLVEKAGTELLGLAVLWSGLTLVTIIDMVFVTRVLKR
ncbi:MAG: LptF/LptG family permease [Phycisphaerales bacterium]|nr:MAG: LptF/LptG family permease [Phycisphaerales bacterium]